MKPSIQKLQKILKLEADRGYDNHAVVGGLDRILEVWKREAEADGLPQDLITFISERLQDYHRHSTRGRAEILQGIWRRIQRSLEEPLAEIESATPLSAAESDSSGAAVERDGLQTASLQPSHHEERRPKAKLQPQVPPSTDLKALDAPLTVIQGIGERSAANLARLGLRTLRDLLYYFPRRYDDYSRLKPINRLVYGEEVTVIGTVQSINTRAARGGRMKITEAIISDGSGALRVTWFNQEYVARRLHPGMQVSMAGKVSQYLGRPTLDNPSWEPLDQEPLLTGRIVPVYGLTEGVHQKWLRTQIRKVVNHWAPRLKDYLPLAIVQSAELMDLSSAIYQAHFPDSWESLHAAQERLAFDEVFLLHLGALGQKRAWQERSARRFAVDEAWLEEQYRRLPFPLTGAQQRVLGELRHDLSSGRPMNRLLQGDVGSGKTVVAALAIAIVVHHGAQAALMAPTSILAEQHFQTLLRLLSEPPTYPLSPLQPEQIALLTGDTPPQEKERLRQALASGEVKVVVGTHALIEDPLSFSDLQLVIIDEQHRFGVAQRAALRAKGDNPHLLVMTATPIPRSLALTIYGDLDLSILDEMPPGRRSVNTYVLLPRERERAYRLIREQVQKGHQAFIVYPRIEGDENGEANAAIEQHAFLQKEVFPDLKLALLHGRMRPSEKDAVMGAFRRGLYHILVSTTVIEVGMDIPNATVMMVEGANRFGLAQLHQLRGRVGRGSDQSFCLLIPENADEAENERLQVMTETNDGFVLAEKDLQQRGPGQFFGVRQSGFAEMQFADLTNIPLIEKACRHAQALFEQDPDLEQAEHQALALALQHFWSGGKGDIS